MLYAAYTSATLAFLPKRKTLESLRIDSRTSLDMGSPSSTGPTKINFNLSFKEAHTLNALYNSSTPLSFVILPTCPITISSSDIPKECLKLFPRCLFSSFNMNLSTSTPLLLPLPKTTPLPSFNIPVLIACSLNVGLITITSLENEQEIFSVIRTIFFLRPFNVSDLRPLNVKTIGVFGKRNLDSIKRKPVFGLPALTKSGFSFFKNFITAYKDFRSLSIDISRLNSIISNLTFSSNANFSTSVPGAETITTS
ncbi:hypothetical protein NU09_0185 [Flavobacterium beibuense]|uniref:Uncharacterized protein n=1 Tax=Flavobacterium beibuense TaxID=657326 RepID=A0A444WIA3_9FLAO|nr:hypothetical protein NU09_0185 [Flavobacterium beibuense]